jgi:ribosomal biogenesis protein LAS1
MQWLLNRYFLPTLSPSTANSTEGIEIPPIDPLLTQYKSLMKAGLKDASLQGRNKPDVDRLLKGFAGWIADVSALYAAELSVRSSDGNTPAQRTKIGTQRFCERLCDKSGLVPTSKRYVLPYLPLQKI